MSRTIVLVRHGETEWNRVGRLQGWTDTDLNRRGRAQARALAEHLAARYDVAEIRSSDLERARRTAVAIESATDADLVETAAWRERGIGTLEGEPYDRLVEHPSLSVSRAGRAALDAAPEGGESLRAMRDRVLDAWADARDDAPDGTVIVTHGGPLYVVLSRVKGLDLVAGLTTLDQANCAINELSVGCGGVELRRENDVVE